MDESQDQAPMSVPKKENTLANALKIVALVAALSAAGYGIYAKESSKEKGLPVFDPDAKIAQVEVTDTSINDALDKLKTFYGEEIPWSKLSTREVSQFFPKDISGLVASDNRIYPSYRGDYLPLDIYQPTAKILVPAKNVLYTTYEYPTVTEGQNPYAEVRTYKIGARVADLDRALTKDELAALKSNEDSACPSELGNRTFYLDEHIMIERCVIPISKEDEDKYREFANGSWDSIYFIDRDL